MATVAGGEPTVSTSATATAKTTNKVSEKEVVNENDATEPEEDNSKAKTQVQVNSNHESHPPKKWLEVGIGPLRVLRRRHRPERNPPVSDDGEETTTTADATTTYRLVQRRESTPGGNATLVILNVRLTTVTIQATASEVHVQIVTVASITNQPETYLFKCKSMIEAKRFKDCLQDCLHDKQRE